MKGKFNQSKDFKTVTATIEVSPDASVAVAAQILSVHHIGCLVVSNNLGKMVGVLSERDIVRAVVAKNWNPAEVRVRDIMTSNVIGCRPGTSMEQAIGLMTKNHIRHLPVVEGGKAVGMISIRDVMVHQLASAQAEIARQRTVLHSLEQEHPGITALEQDDSGRIMI
ncbi:MAG: CBS domain-containing protein [Phycisphaerae bacterium]|nr:CBS domain-containing protein [Phycisphaerae bacterium]